MGSNLKGLFSDYGVGGRCALLLILKIFSGELIAFLKNIHKKLQKLQIFKQSFLYLFSHILHTVSLALSLHLLNFIPQILTIFFYEFSNWIAGLVKN